MWMDVVPTSNCFFFVFEVVGCKTWNLIEHLDSPNLLLKLYVYPPQISSNDFFR